MGQIGHSSENVRIPIGDTLMTVDFIIEELLHREIKLDEVDTQKLLPYQNVPKKDAEKGKKDKDRQQVPPREAKIRLKVVPGTSIVRKRLQGASRMLKMDFFHNQTPPETYELLRGFDEAREVEKLRLAVGAVVVVNRDFLEPKSEILELLHHL